jgi:arginase
MNRREFTKMMVAVGAAGRLREERRVRLVLAPSNLGLRANEDGSQQGAWRAPEALMKAGLAQRIRSAEVVSLKRPDYNFDAQFGTSIRNGLSIRAFSLELGEKVREALEAGCFPLVIGGDCSIMLGCMVGARLAGGRGLIHIDGHSDFVHPGNYNPSTRLGSAAGMDLALASGRGELLLTRWPQINGPLTEDADIVQIGERESGTPDFKRLYGDIVHTRITQIFMQDALSAGMRGVVQQVLERLVARGLDRVWLHVDCDVLDQTVMPAVDSPGSPGLDFGQLQELVSALCDSGRICGADFTIYDPERDPDAKYSKGLVDCIARGVTGNAADEEQA